MFIDRDGNPTDDADRVTSGAMEEFAPGDDYDPMYAGYERGPKCANRDGVPCCCDPHTGKFVGPGCRHCNPPDHEGKPYGFGIETFDSPEWAEARRHFFGVWRFATGQFDAHQMDWRHLLKRWATDAGWSERRLKCSDRVWDRLCDTCDTHTEAVEKYERWARKATA